MHDQSRIPTARGSGVAVIRYEIRRRHKPPGWMTDADERFGAAQGQHTHVDFRLIPQLKPAGVERFGDVDRRGRRHFAGSSAPTLLRKSSLRNGVARAGSIATPSCPPSSCTAATTSESAGPSSRACRQTARLQVSSQSRRPRPRLPTIRSRRGPGAPARAPRLVRLPERIRK